MPETRFLLGQGDIDSALAFLRQIHTSDQGDALVVIRDRIRLILLACLEPSETAEIIEHIEPEEAVAIFVGMDIASLVNILDVVIIVYQITESIQFSPNHHGFYNVCNSMKRDVVLTNEINRPTIRIRPPFFPIIFRTIIF